MEQIAMYLRLSKEDEFIRDESNSITNQRAFIRNYINKDKALRKMNVLDLWTMVIPVKYGPSGYAEDADLVKRKQISGVIVKDFSRFPETTLNREIHRADIPFYGCSVYCYQ